MVWLIRARESQRAEVVLSLSSDGIDAADGYALIGARYCHESRMVRVYVFSLLMRWFCGQGFLDRVVSIGLC